MTLALAWRLHHSVAVRTIAGDYGFWEGGLLPVCGDGHHRDRDFKDRVDVIGLEIAGDDSDSIGGGRPPQVDAANAEAEQGAVVDALGEGRRVHGPGDEAAAGEFAQRGDVGVFVNPLQHAAAEEVSVVIEMLWPDQGVEVHVRLPCSDAVDDGTSQVALAFGGVALVMAPAVRRDCWC